MARKAPRQVMKRAGGKDERGNSKNQRPDRGGRSGAGTKAA